MKYFFDTEFIEGFHKPFLGKRRHFIDLISIGIVAEDGREYYAVSNEFDPDDADDWVKENVIAKLPADLLKWNSNSSGGILWKSNKTIASEIKQFLGYKPEFTDYGSDEFTDDKNIEFWAYYADYDWVVFCGLFGRMINLPKGMPMYCRDLKQEFDLLAESIANNSESDPLVVEYKGMTVKQISDSLKKDPNYPKNVNHHDALSDAKWNLGLWKFINGIK